jgi:hypothetical protein
LRRFCSNAGTLDDYLYYLQDQELAHQDSGVWRKTPQWAHVDNIGRTLEWYVSQWFRFELGATARYGVHVPDLPGGGDLDVVAIMDGIRLAVECKSGREIAEKQLRYFLLRARAFQPALAILLLDTDADGPMEQTVKSLNSLNEKDPAGDSLTVQNQAKTLYWGMQRVYVVNVKKQSVGAAIASALRLYHSEIG